MKVGLIYCSFGTLDLTPASLAPWLAAKASRLGGHDYVIAAVSCPFSGFPDAKDDGAVDYLFKQVGHEKIDHLVVSDVPIPETEARGRALRWLVEHGATYIWQVDADENYTPAQITAILRFIEGRPADWYRLCLRNQVFTPNRHLVEPFTPPRIHRVYNPGGFVAAGFHQDNNVYYERPWSGERVLDTQMASLTVPKGAAWIDHASWLNNARSKAKIDYQRARGWSSCSFSWDDSQGGLIWNPSLPIPETAIDFS